MNLCSSPLGERRRCKSEERSDASLRSASEGSDVASGWCVQRKSWIQFASTIRHGIHTTSNVRRPPQSARQNAAGSQWVISPSACEHWRLIWLISRYTGRMGRHLHGTPMRMSVGGGLDFRADPSRIPPPARDSHENVRRGGSRFSSKSFENSSACTGLP
jgi:hypothetical protein